MITVDDYIQATFEKFQEAGIFFGHGTDNALDEAVYLVFATLGLDYDDGAAGSRRLSSAEIETLNTRRLDRIESRTPMAYLVGEAWFGGRRFLADSRALIPRSPIAELLIEKSLPFLDREPESILDLCCGGGCIGITAALEFDGACVDLADLSAEALELARENVTLHGLGREIRTLQSDLFDSIHSSYDLILSNPPYVPAEEVAELPAEYGHEPELGLLSDDEGLAIPLRILREAPNYLRDRGLLVLEVGHSHLQLSERLAGVPLLWLDFAYGGEGVLAITREDLLLYRESFV